MSDIDSIQQSSQTQQIQQTETTQEEQQIQPVGGSEDTVDMNARFSSYNEFAQTYPKLHTAMMNGIAQSILNDLKHHDERMKKIMKENQ